MRMHNPSHPGEILSEFWLTPLGLSIHETATRLNVSDNSVVELVNGKMGISPEMALRLELAFGKGAESWLAHQAAFDLWQLEFSREQLGVIRVAA